MSCCNESGCKRKKPILIGKGGLSDIWYAITDYSESEHGLITAKTKHVVRFISDPN